MATLFVVDVEADGPIPGTDCYSMVCFGCVMVDKGGELNNTFYGELKPISKKYKPEALAISGFKREQHEKFDEPYDVMLAFDNWLNQMTKGNKIFISDNLAFDWQYINYYFHYFLNKNPFGFSGQRIGDKFQGFFNDPYYKWKQHRVTKHTHNPVDDAKGNAEALLFLNKKGYKLW
jgi:DNA polymerase III epsilon subunit-like protein